MLTRTIAAYRARIANANERDVAYYRSVMAGYEEYPFELDGSTELARAVWLDMKGLLTRRPMNPIKAYMKDRGWNAKTMATAVGLKLNTFYKVLSDNGCHGSRQLVLDYMAANPVECRVIEPVDIKDWHRSTRKLDELFELGKVKSVQIHLEV